MLGLCIALGATSILQTSSAAALAFCIGVLAERWRTHVRAKTTASSARRISRATQTASASEPSARPASPAGAPLPAPSSHSREWRQRLAALRGKGEALWPGGGLPAALDDEGYLSALLEKSASRDPLWAERKLCAAVEYRRGLVTGGGGAARCAGGTLRAAPASTHSAVLAIPAVVRLLRGGAAEPLLSDAALQEAGRVLRRGALYWHGFDASGGPIMWAHTGRMDLRDAEPSAWGRAVATLIEVGVVGTRARRAGEGCRVGSGVGAAVGDSDGRSEAPRCDRFVYVECADGFSLGPKVPLTRAVAVARRSLAALFGGSPERFAGAVVAPASRTNRILFSLARHFIPASTARRIHFFGQTEQLRAFFRRRELGLDSAVLPACLGGSATHVLPRTPSGDVDLAAMLREIAGGDGGADDADGAGGAGGAGGAAPPRSPPMEAGIEAARAKAGSAG